MTDIQIWLL